jgi:hypothetical protein
MLVARDHSRQRDQKAEKPDAKSVLQIGDFSAAAKN